MAISGCAIGLVFGTLAGQAGLGAGEAALMSALVFSFLNIGMHGYINPTLTVLALCLRLGDHLKRALA